MGSGKPIVRVFALCVAVETGRVGIASLHLREANDLRSIATTIHVETARTVAVLARQALLGMKSMPKIFRLLLMARGADIGSDPIRASNGGGQKMLGSGALLLTCIYRLLRTWQLRNRQKQDRPNSRNSFFE
jgi:hypothetical protein